MNIDVPDFATSIGEQQRKQLVEDGCIRYGRCLTEEQLIAARYAYERTYEKFDPEQEAIYSLQEHERVIWMKGFWHEPALTSIIANPTLQAMARAALGTDEIEFIGSILRKRRILDPWGWPDANGWTGWHSDTFLVGDPATWNGETIAFMVYLDDTTRSEGSTEILPGTSRIVRDNYRAGRDRNEGLAEIIRKTDTSDEGVFCEAPAGGGMGINSFVFHRAIPESSGLIRRHLTVSYRVRGSKEVGDGEYQDLPEEVKASVAASMPEDMRDVL
jgi:hypothetical protein